MEKITQITEILANLSISLPMVGGIWAVAALIFFLLKGKKPDNDRRGSPAGRDVQVGKPDDVGIVQPEIHDHEGDSGIFDDDSVVDVKLPDGSVDPTPVPVGVDDDDLEDVVAVQPKVENVTRLEDSPKPYEPPPGGVSMDELINRLKSGEKNDR